MSDLKRHIGRLRNTDRKIVVVYMDLPGSPGRALIVDTDALPDQFHESLMTVVESESAQHSINLADVLDRRASPDAGLNLMNCLHQRGFLRPEPIDNIVMFPRPNMPFPLSQIIALTKNKLEPPVVPEPAPKQRREEYVDNDDFEMDARQENLEVARSLLDDAEMLEQQVTMKRNQAYQIAPSLRPMNSPRAQERASESNYPPKIDLTFDQTPAEYREIMARAQEHLDRAAFRDEQAEMNVLETAPEPTPPRETVPVKKAPRIKKKQE